MQINIEMSRIAKTRVHDKPAGASVLPSALLFIHQITMKGSV